MLSKTPLKGVTVFTDGSGSSHKSVVTWKDPRMQKWESDIQVVEDSLHIAELAAVIRAFEKFKQFFSLVTDSAYVAKIVTRAEYSALREISNPNIFHLVSKSVKLISHRKQPLQPHVMHVRSHTELPGAITEGNRRADILAMPVEIPQLPNVFEQAKPSNNLSSEHACFHKDVSSLVRAGKGCSSLVRQLSIIPGSFLLSRCQPMWVTELPTLGN